MNIILVKITLTYKHKLQYSQQFQYLQDIFSRELTPKTKNWLFFFQNYETILQLKLLYK